ncbi:MAG TPA: LacI family DNA-binding transcriptional regulator [Abditibacteriaceae bacterium]|jgi:DNA-binding LacI/PurR family transcriptional regulator
MLPIQHQTKTQALREHLAQLIGTMEPHAKLPTMRELCATLRVSPMTVNRALSELEAHGAIYRRQGSGTYVAARVEIPESKPTIGLVYDRDVFGSGMSPFGGLLIEAARQRAESHDERFSFYFAMPSADGMPVHDDLVQALQEKRLNGVLFVGEQNPQALQWLQQQAVPLVALAYTPIAPYRVKIDHAHAVRLGVKALAEQGCRRIGLWIPHGVGLGRTGKQKSFPELDAFKQALKRHNLPYNPEWVWQLDSLTSDVPLDAEPNQEQGLRAAHEVFSKKNKASATHVPDALIIDDDMMTRGALVAFDKLGIRAGSNIKVASHTNRGSTVLTGYEDELILIEVDPAEIVQAMFDMLESLMQGQTPAATIVIKPHLAR